jgi:alkanesulfonate monooxygenase SsuD/methylene tetrahydromethanopterin reductase-like flavin-dependent oxidoreductase (luciferase family)
MQFGLYLRSFLTDRTRSLQEQIADVIELCHVARDSGFSAVSMPQHWVSYPTTWPQPFQMLARLTPETGDMRLMTGIVLLPLHNPLQIAEDVATLDQICNGRFTLGAGIGYRETELEAAGATRKERAPRLTESIELMKKLWTGEVINHEGRFWTVHDAQMGFVPVQQPHPPIWIACQSEGAVRRAARIADACYLAPQVGFDNVEALIGIYRDERAKTGQDEGQVTISRGVAFGTDKATATAEALASAQASYRMYATWNMQEDTMVKINIEEDSKVDDWAVAGNAEDCIEGFGRLEAMGVDFVGATFYNIPKGLEARKEYLQRFAEGVIGKMS